MPTVISFSDRDMLRGKIVTPAWYRLRIISVGEAPAKVDPNNPKPPSTNYPVEAVILFNGDNGSTEFAGVPIEWNFNSKALGFAVGFLQGFGADVQSNTRYDLKSAENKEIDVFVENDTWNGRPKNQVNHKYRRPKTDVTAAS